MRRPPVIPLLLCLVIGALGGIGTALATKPAPAQPLSFTPLRVPPPDFRLRDQNGFWNAPKDARGEVLVITFLFSRCRDLCPRQAAEVKDAVLGAGDGVRVFAITVDPEHDTPELARAWLRKMGVEGGPVRFLLGTREELTPVWNDFGIVPIVKEDPAEEAEEDRGKPAYRPPETPAEKAAAERERLKKLRERPPPEAALEAYPDGDDLRYRGRARHGGGLDYEHSAYVLLVDKQGRQRVGFPFERLTAEALLHDIRKLKAEQV